MKFELEIVKFNVNDVITTSSGNEGCSTNFACTEKPCDADF